MFQKYINLLHVVGNRRKELLLELVKDEWGIAKPRMIDFSSQFFPVRRTWERWFKKLFFATSLSKA